MSDVVQEISEDYDHDSTPVADPADFRPGEPIEDPFTPIDQELIECESLDQELDRLMQATIAIENYGMTPTTFGVMKATNLLVGTSLDVLAMESFNNDGPQSPESLMAVESLIDSIKEKAAAWSAKIISFTKNSTTKLFEMLTALKDKILEKGKLLTDKAWDVTKSAGRTIKAHPYKTVMLAIGAAIVVMTIVAMAATPGTYTSVDSLKAFALKLKNTVANLKSPFGKAEVVINTTSITTTKITPDVLVSDPVKEAANRAARSALWKKMGMPEPTNKLISVKFLADNAPSSTVTVVETVEKLGWSQTAVKSILGQFSKLWSVTKSGMTTVASPIINVAKKINDVGGEASALVGAKVTEKTGSKLAGWAANKWVDKVYTGLLFSIIGVIYKLVKDVVLKAYHTVLETFDSLKAEPQTA